MAVKRVRGFYAPPTGQVEKLEIAEGDHPEELTSGALLVIASHDDGTRTIVSEKTSGLTAKQKKAIAYGKRFLQFKFDGGDTPDLLEERKGIHT